MMASYQNKVHVLSDRVNPVNIRETNQNITQVVNKVERKQGCASKVYAASSNILLPPTPSRSQPKIDATDRRQSEALSEDRYQTSKEEHDDSKYVYKKEKKKKEQMMSVYVDHDVSQWDTRALPTVRMIKIKKRNVMFKV